MGRGQSTGNYEVCWPDNDPMTWFIVSAYDAEAAAEAGAEDICSRDNDCYRSFMGGEVLLVRDVGGGNLCEFKVEVEMLPSFNARPVKRASQPKEPSNA